MTKISVFQKIFSTFDPSFLGEIVQQANNEISEIESSTAKETVALQVELKRLKIQNQSLQSQLDRKDSENQELTQICDELIANAHR